MQWNTSVSHFDKDNLWKLEYVYGRCVYISESLSLQWQQKGSISTHSEKVIYSLKLHIYDAEMKIYLGSVLLVLLMFEFVYDIISCLFLINACFWFKSGLKQTDIHVHISISPKLGEQIWFISFHLSYCHTLVCCNPWPKSLSWPWPNNMGQRSWSFVSRRNYFLLNKCNWIHDV